MTTHTYFHARWSRSLALPLHVCWCKESFVRIHQNGVRPLHCASRVRLHVQYMTISRHADNTRARVGSKHY